MVLHCYHSSERNQVILARGAVGLGQEGRCPGAGLAGLWSEANAPSAATPWSCEVMQEVVQSSRDAGCNMLGGGGTHMLGCWAQYREALHPQPGWEFCSKTVFFMPIQFGKWNPNWGWHDSVR